MKFSEAVQNYEQGKPIRLKSWPPGIKLAKNQLSGYLSLDHMNGEWELVDDTVELQTLKGGDKFSFSGSTLTYVLLPAYMLEFTSVAKDSETFLPVMLIRGTGDTRIDFASKFSKVVKFNG